MKNGRARAVLLAVAFLAAGCGPQVRRSPGPAAVAAAFIAGGGMDQAEADRLEKVLEKSFTDEEARLKLIGYYEQRRYTSELGRPHYIEHVLYFVKNRQESEIHRMAVVTLLGDGIASYDLAKKLWLEQADGAGAENAAIVANASHFFASSDDVENAERLLFRALGLAGKTPEPHRDLGVLYFFPAVARKAGNRDLAVRRALEELDKAYALAVNREQKFQVLIELARGSFSAGSVAKSEEYVKKLLDEAGGFTSHWRYGEAMHTADTIRGHLAFMRGKTDEAKEMLLASARVPPSPRLVAWGPEFSLASDLMAKGEKAAVAEYLELVGKFWRREAVLERWKKDMAEGRNPDFGSRF